MVLFWADTPCPSMQPSMHRSRESRMKETTWSISCVELYIHTHIYILGMHRIFGHRNFLAENGPNTFLTETIWQKCCDDANRNRDLHVLVWSNMSAVWTYFSISEKDPRTANCKTCNAEISRGGASAKTFSASGLIYHLKSPPSTPTPSVADVFEKDVSQWHMGYGSLCFYTLLCWKPTEKILLYL